MVSVYKDADYLAVYKQKKRIFALFMGVLAAYLAICIGMLVYYIGLPYNHPHQKIVKGCAYVLSALFVIFSVPYLGIKYSRVRRYFRMLTYVSEGLKNEEKNYFYTFEQKSLQKDNIDVVACIFETWNKKKQEWMDREVYCDPEMPQLPFEAGDFVQYVSQSNFIVQYVIVEKKALEFEEVEEEEYKEDVEEVESERGEKDENEA